jgi:two-component system, NarL family, response regulator NreC
MLCYRRDTTTGPNFPTFMAIRILLADDHELVREGFRVLLERQGFEVVGEAADGYKAIQLAAELKPEVALLDVSMPLLNGLDATREMARVSPSTRILILTMYTEDRYVLDALKAGACGFILKTRAGKDLVEAIQRVSKGSLYLGPETSDAVVRAYRTNFRDDGIANLSSRERQVLQLVAEGKTTKEVASVLGISSKTASAHRERLMKKLDVHETAGLVRYAIRMGLVLA